MFFGRFKARWLYLKLKPVPVVVYFSFLFQLRRNCEVDDQKVHTQIQRHKRDEEKTPNRLDVFYSHINSEGQKIREMIK